ETLRAGGYGVKVTLRHDLFLQNRTFEGLSKQVAKDAKSGKMCVAENGVAVCSLADKIETDLPGAEKKGHILGIPHFGKIAFAEVFAEPGTKTLTMLRLELGSPDSGLLTTAET